MAAGCQNPGTELDSKAATTGSLAGTVTLPGEVKGRKAYVIVDTDSNGDNGQVKTSETTVTGKSFAFSFTDLAPGSYYVYALVQVVGEGSGGPVTGNYLGFAGSGSGPAAAANMIVSAGKTSQADIVAGVYIAKGVAETVALLTGTWTQTIGNTKWTTKMAPNPGSGTSGAYWSVTMDPPTFGTDPTGTWTVETSGFVLFNSIAPDRITQQLGTYSVKGGTNSLTFVVSGTNSDPGRAQVVPGTWTKVTN